MSRAVAEVWTPEMDDLLIERRVRKALPWRSVAPIGGMNERKCQKRLKVLQGSRPVAAVAATGERPSGEASARDGLVWLRQHKQVSDVQAMVGLDYRSLFRHVVDFGGADVQSSLNALMSVGGGKGGGVMGGSYTAAGAKVELFRIRWVVLGGQADLLTVMDGVCGVGHTIAFLAGPKRDRMREEQLKAALRIALDLLVADKRDKPKKAA